MTVSSGASATPRRSVASTGPTKCCAISDQPSREEGEEGRGKWTMRWTRRWTSSHCRRRPLLPATAAAAAAARGGGAAAAARRGGEQQQHEEEEQQQQHDEGGKQDNEEDEEDDDDNGRTCAISHSLTFPMSAGRSRYSMTPPAFSATTHLATQTPAVTRAI